MKERYPSVPWIEFLQRITGLVETLNNESLIKVLYPVYLDCFISLVNSTDPRILANYVGWRVVLTSTTYLHEAALSLKFDRVNLISDLPYSYRSLRWQGCLSLLEENMREAAGAMYVRRYFNDDLIAPAYEMVKYIQNAFLDILDQNDWMSSVTKEEAREKAESMKVNIGYPDEYKDNTKLSSLYEGVIRCYTFLNQVKM
ncbi:unnamed protein product [Orchesella dallaii]|uniref:Peptidase M13 N-terminal domain-containing protein n=1 Tax=Orchesella dallaii TaxID=48710 RepID=A0ABP1S144_9HEXA